MKGSEFINLMRKVIREEVRAVVKEELKAFKPLLMETEKQKPVVKKPAAPVAKPHRTQPLVQFDGPLKSILEETARSMQQAPQEEWSEMGTMTSEDAPGFTSNGNLRAAMSGDPTAMFVKDYSAVLKTAEQIANNNYRS